MPPSASDRRGPSSSSSCKALSREGDLPGANGPPKLAPRLATRGQRPSTERTRAARATTDSPEPRCPPGRATTARRNRVRTACRRRDEHQVGAGIRNADHNDITAQIPWDCGRHPRCGERSQQEAERETARDGDHGHGTSARRVSRLLEQRQRHSHKQRRRDGENNRATRQTRRNTIGRGSSVRWGLGSQGRADQRHEQAGAQHPRQLVPARHRHQGGNAAPQATMGATSDMDPAARAA